MEPKPAQCKNLKEFLYTENPLKGKMGRLIMCSAERKQMSQVLVTYDWPY